VLYWLTGYSIIDNFFVANSANKEIVRSNFESLEVYLVYFLMNIFAFTFYLGLPSLYLLFSKLFRPCLYPIPYTLYPMLLGPAMVLLFSIIGIFQGEVERIWLFLAPLFITIFSYNPKKIIDKDFSVLILCLAWQIIIMQILFYTYW
jgi:hypothetical protein